jgi:hypothetical protein
MSRTTGRPAVVSPGTLLAAFVVAAVLWPGAWLRAQPLPSSLIRPLPPPSTTPPSSRPSASEPTREPATAPAPAPAASPAPGAKAPSGKKGQPRPLVVGGPVEIALKDGRRINGLLLEQAADRVVLRIGDVATTFPLDTIASMVALPPIEEQYRRLRDSLADEDVEGHLRLAEWVRSHGRLDLALWEIEHVLSIQPGHPIASDLRTVVVEQDRINRSRPRPRPAVEEAEGPALAPARPEFPLLSPAQINLMRVYEVDLKDPPRMVLTRDTMRRFLESYAGRAVEGRGAVPVTPEARELFYRQKPAEALAWMFDLRAREYYGEVQVLDSPRAFRLFRDNVHRTWLINSCASSRCHGGPEAGRLWLHNQRTSSDASVYTNFLILDRFVTSSGQKLINYRDPAESALLQLAMAPDAAVFRHPEITGIGRGKWKPVFLSRQDERFKQAVEWIRAMYPQRTGYPIQYTPPSPPGALGPGEQPPPR